MTGYRRTYVSPLAVPRCPDCGEPANRPPDGLGVHIPGCSRAEAAVSVLSSNAPESRREPR